MDIILKNIKLVRANYPEKGEPEAYITRIPTKEEEPIICKQIDQLFNNLLDTHLNEEDKFPIDLNEFEEIIRPLFFYEKIDEGLFWAITFDSIQTK